MKLKMITKATVFILLNVRMIAAQSFMAVTISENKVEFNNTFDKNS